MDSSNLTIVERLRPKGAKAQVHLIRSYEPKMTNMNVPDPYYGGPDGFQEVYDILEIATEGLIQVIIEEKQLRV